MLFVKNITEDDVILDLKASNIDEAIKKLIDLAEENGYIKNKEEVLNRVLHREKIKPTLFEGEVLAPHIASDLVQREAVIFGRSRVGIPLDGNKVRYMFFVAVPSNKKGRMFDMLSEIAFVAKDKKFLAELKAARNIDDILFALQHKRIPLVVKLKRKLARLQAAFA